VTAAASEFWHETMSHSLFNHMVTRRLEDRFGSLGSSHSNCPGHAEYVTLVRELDKKRLRVVHDDQHPISYVMRHKRTDYLPEMLSVANEKKFPVRVIIDNEKEGSPSRFFLYQTMVTHVDIDCKVLKEVNEKVKAKKSLTERLKRM
jgi:hypothetical protein